MMTVKSYRATMVSAITAALLLLASLPAQADREGAGAINKEDTGQESTVRAPVRAPVRAAFNAKAEDVIFGLTNKARIEHCLPVLFRNTSIDRVARNWSQEMGTTGYFEHNPHYSTQMPQKNLRAWAENIAVGYPDGAAMFEGWKSSPGHWANILRSNITDIGIGFMTGPAVQVRDSNGSFGWAASRWGTQNFATYSHHQGGAFLDVRKGHTFYSEIEWLANTGVTTGYDVEGCGEKVFKPRNKVTREAMAAFIYRFSGSPKFTPPAKSPFSDVSTKHTFYTEITWLDEQGITTGYDDGTFRPRNQITREAMAAFLHRLAGSPNATAAPTFRDVPKGHTFYKEITWMAAEGITTGYGNGASAEFRPRNHTTREATAAFLQRY